MFTICNVQHEGIQKQKKLDLYTEVRFPVEIKREIRLILGKVERQIGGGGGPSTK